MQHCLKKRTGLFRQESGCHLSRLQTYVPPVGIVRKENNNQSFIHVTLHLILSSLPLNQCHFIAIRLKNAPLKMQR